MKSEQDIKEKIKRYKHHVGGESDTSEQNGWFKGYLDALEWVLAHK